MSQRPALPKEWGARETREKTRKGMRGVGWEGQSHRSTRHWTRDALLRDPAWHFQKEIFCPVVCAIPFESAEEIPAVANQTLYGLAASIWTRDISKALRLAKALNAGAVWVNCSDVFDPNLPWGGFKQSGWGRELGQEGVEAFTELKAVTIKL